MKQGRTPLLQTAGCGLVGVGWFSTAPLFTAPGKKPTVSYPSAALEAVDPIPSDYEAWAEVQAEIRRVGNAGQPQFSHALVAQAVGLFGWRYLCLSENPVADRSHFIQAYQALRENVRRETRRAQRVTAFIAALKRPGRRLLPDGQVVRTQ